MQVVHSKIPKLESMKKYPKSLFYRGDLSLLKKNMISIVGTRKPNQYTKQLTFELATKLSSAGVCIVSGAAMGVDAIAHKGAGSSNTIAVMANGLDIVYPQVNRSLIEEIEKEGLTLSQFESGFKATKWSFVVRNEIVVALGDVLIVTQADLNSGTMRSVEFAKKMGKKIYVLPHRHKESEGTSSLLKSGDAEAIYDIDEFVSMFSSNESTCKSDTFLNYCMKTPSYEEAVLKFGDRVFEYELDGKIRVDDGFVLVV
ncbi:MAG: DNA-processing protein DprA [Campylobacterota bacterium]|nr:DNA-processing protein DprA [Campylobacterota bacterium]